MYWATGDGDWSTIALLMRHQIRRTRKHIKQHNIVLDTPRICRQLLIAEHLLGRMLEEPYYDLATARFPAQGEHWGKMVTSLMEQDSELLATLLRRHLRTWWD